VRPGATCEETSGDNWGCIVPERLGDGDDEGKEGLGVPDSLIDSRDKAFGGKAVPGSISV
jgi:hypothetical protein